MEDAATAEISRSQLWQWLHRAVALDDGRPMTVELYASIRGEELARLQSGGPSSRVADAARILDTLVLAEQFEPFLTVVAYPRLG
jgi:malate synthase